MQDPGQETGDAEHGVGGLLRGVVEVVGVGAVGVDGGDWLGA